MVCATHLELSFDVNPDNLGKITQALRLDELCKGYKKEVPRETHRRAKSWDDPQLLRLHGVSWELSLCSKKGPEKSDRDGLDIKNEKNSS